MVSPRQLSLAYAVVFAAVGAFGPWLGLVLVNLGHAERDVALWLALMPATSVFAAPAWAWVADRYRLGTRILQFTTASAALLGAVMTIPLPSLVVASVLVSLGIMRSGMGLVLDAFTLRTLEESGTDPTRYGRIRRWGSVGFVFGTAAGAAVDAAWVAAPLALGAALWGLASVGFATLPRVPAKGKPRVLAALWALARSPGLGFLLVALPLYGLGMTSYDAWYAVHIQGMGISPWWTAAAITVGVATEVVVLSQATAIFQRVSPAWLVVGAMLVGAVRWAFVAWLTNPFVLTALHLSHGLVFGAFWVGTVEWLRRTAPPEIRASAQMALPVLGYGVGPILTGLVARQLVPEYGTPALFAVASVAALLAALLTAVAAIRSAPGYDPPR